MAAVDDYLAGLAGGSGKKRSKSQKPLSSLLVPSAESAPFAVSSDESFKKLLQQIGSVQKSRAGLLALGKKPSTSPRPGILQTLLGQEKGILTAPFRFVSALASEAFDLPVQDVAAQEAMSKYGALESAFRSAKGEFAVTGGDIFKTNENDSFMERLGKWAGALAFDITLDPINWFGPTGIIGRKGGAVILARQGDSLLPALTTAVAQEGKNAAPLVDKLFKSSKAFEAAMAGDTELISRLGIVDGVATNETQKLAVAGQEFAKFVGENYYVGGRSGLRKALVNFTGSEAVADKIFKSMPEEIAGGLFLKNPITGKPLKQLSGGTGKVLPGLDLPVQLANQGRFVVAAAAPGRFMSEHFATRIGPAWAEVKKGMIGGVELGKNKRTTLYEFTAFRDELRRHQIDVRNIGLEGTATLSAARGAINALENEEEKLAYQGALSTHFFMPKAAVQENATEATKAGVEMAHTLHALKNSRHQQLLDAGVPVQSLGPDQVPLRYTKEHIEYLESQGIDVGSEAYSMSHGRQREIRYITDPEAARQAGYQIPDQANVTALTAPELNRLLGTNPRGNKIYIDDPVVAMADYMESTGKVLAARRFANALKAANVIYKTPEDVVKLINERTMATLVSAMPNVAAATRRKWGMIKERNEKALQEMIDKGEISGVQVAARYEKASAAYEAAQVAEDAARANVVAANAQVNQLRPRVAQLEADVTEAMRVGEFVPVDDLQRQARNAASRTSKAKNKAAETAAQAQSTAARAAQPIFDPNTYKYTDASVARAVLPEMQDDAAKAQAKLSMETLTLQSAQRQLQDAVSFRESVAGRLTTERMQALQEFEGALSAQVQAVAALEQAREVRRFAAREATLALKDTSLSRATTLRALVDDHIKAAVGFREVRARLGKKIADFTDEERAVYDQAKAVMDETRETLKRMVGYSTRKDAQAVGASYYKELMRVVNVLTDDEFMSLRLLFDAEALDDFVKQLENVNFNAHMNVIGDMVTTYKNIRKKLSIRDIAKLGELEKEVMTGKKIRRLQVLDENGMSAYVKADKRVSKATQELYSEAGFAKVGSGPNKGRLRIPLPLKDAYAAKGIRGVLEDIYRVHDNPTDWQRFIQDLYDPLALVWKTGATAARGPAFIMNNIAGGITNNYSGGVTVKDHLLAAKATTVMISVARDIARKNPGKSEVELVDLVAAELERRLDGVVVGGRKLSDLFTDFLERGGHFGTDTAWQLQELQRLGIESRKPLRARGGFQARYSTEATNIGEKGYRRLAAFFLDNRVQRKFNDWSQSSEVFLRFAAFVSGWKRFRDLNSAMDLTYMLHFDYQDVSNAEIWLKRFIPFYTWSRNNLPLQMRAFFLQNDRIRKLYMANEEAKAAFGVEGDAAWLNDYMPDWLATSSGFITNFKIGGNHLALFPKLPLYDLDKFLSVGYIGSLPVIVPRMNEFINLTGPAVKTPIEFLTGRNFTFGYKYNNFAELLMAQGRNIFPYAGTAKRLLSVSGLPVDENRRISNLINSILGTPYGATMITEKTIAGEAFRDSVALSAQLKKAATEANVDIEWLRKQFEDGKNLNQVVASILSGQGSIESVSLRKMLEEAKKGPKRGGRDYRDILTGLQTGEINLGY